MFRHLLLLIGLIVALPAAALDSPLALRELYTQQVDRRLDIPVDEQQHYVTLLDAQLQQAGLKLAAQFVVLVDRNPRVQALLLYWITEDGEFAFIGASPVSTGKKGEVEYFETPVGVFDHSVANMDFRSEGTANEQGIRGYGAKGLRVYDFGWVTAQRTWRPGEGTMRLLIHATDPTQLEARLGTVQSKGCIRIPATLNRFIDFYGILDADYAHAKGKALQILPAESAHLAWSGRYLVVVDSGVRKRPAWSPLPAAKSSHRKPISVESPGANN